MGFVKNFSLIFLSLFLFFTLAYAAPGIPHQFYGTVTVNGSLADGASIVAKIDNIQVAITTSSGGTYGLIPNIFYIEDPNGNRNGKKIEFFLNTNKVAESTFENGASTPLDLSYGVAPFCGDTICNAGESCSTCSTDCGACPPPAPPGGGTGGGSGGGGGGSGGGGGGSGGGSGSAGGSLLITVTGNCVSQPIRVTVLNINNNIVEGAEVIVMKNNNEIAKQISNSKGNASFTFDENGRYEFMARKAMMISGIKRVDLNVCIEAPPQIPAEPPAETKDFCKNKNCNDNNPCTEDSCDKASGFCEYNLLDNTPCGENLVCTKGECVLTVQEPETSAPPIGFFGLGPIAPLALGILVIVIIAIAAFIIWKKKKQ